MWNDHPNIGSLDHGTYFSVEHFLNNAQTNGIIHWWKIVLYFMEAEIIWLVNQPPSETGVQ